MEYQIKSIDQASKGSPPVRGAGYEPLLLKPGESQETPTHPHRSRQQTNDEIGCERVD